MAFLWVRESDQDDARTEADGGREYSRYFDALAESFTDNLSALVESLRAEGILEPHPDDPFSLPTSIEPEREPGTLLWRCRVNYGRNTREQEEENPLDRSTKFELDSAEVQRIRLLDTEGKPIVNKAGELLLDPPPTEEVSLLVLRFRKNITVRLPRWVIDYRNAVNSDTVKIYGLPFEKDVLKLKRLRFGEIQREHLVDYLEITGEIWHDPDGWTQRYPNRGFNELVGHVDEDGESTGEDGVLSQILIKGEPPSQPVWLDENGQAFRDEAGRVRHPQPEEIVTLEYDLSRRLPFSRLPLR